MAFLLSRLGYQASHKMSAALGGLGLELRQFGLLRLLAASRGSSQRALGAMLQISPNRMVALIDGLESKGLIERRTHPEDRRAYTVTITDAGAAVLGAAMEAGIGVELDMCAPLEASEREQLLALLYKLVTASDDGAAASRAYTPACSNATTPPRALARHTIPRSADRRARRIPSDAIG